MTFDDQRPNAARLCGSYRFDNTLIVRPVTTSWVHVKVHVDGTLEQAGALGFSIGLAVA